MKSWPSSIGWRRREKDRAREALSRILPSGASLRLQLVFLVTLSLLPMALWSFVQGMERASRDTADVREQLITTARTAATPAQNVLASADQVARAVSNLPSVRNVSAQCNQDLTAALHGLLFFTNIGRLDATGKVVCAANPRAIGLVIPDRVSWTEYSNRNDFIVGNESFSPVSHSRVVPGILPLRNAAGAFQGAIGIAIDVRWLDYMVRASALSNGSVVALFDRAGNIIASNETDAARAVFRFARRAPASGTALSAANDASGHGWFAATHALLGDNVFVGFAMRQSTLLRPTYIHVGTDFLLPFLMLAVSWIAIWLVTERQLTRWIIYLRRISGAYRAGHYALKPALAGAPSEFRMLGEALSIMAASIQERDRSLRVAIEQKSLLIREIHHRVKNNLQIVMSLLSLQASRINDPVAEDALTRARVRINALALVHRILYEIEDQQSVDAKSLLELLAEQTNEGFGGDRRDIRTLVRAASLHVSGDLAVPIALFAVEALTNAFKHGYPAGRGGTIRVTFGRAGDKFRLAVEDDGLGFESGPGDAHSGSRLMRTFGQQLGGAVSVHSSIEYGTIAELIFPAPRDRG